jgi:hypothetical protein
MSHGGPYNQDSTDVAGPTAAQTDLKAKLWAAEPVPITIAVSSVYPNGERAVWANTKTEVLKWVLGPSGLRLAQRHRRVEPASVEISGAYTLVDKDGRYFVPRDMTIDQFFNVTEGRAESIEWPRSLTLKYPRLKPTRISLPQTQTPLFAGQPPKRPLSRNTITFSMAAGRSAAKPAAVSRRIASEALIASPDQPAAQRERSGCVVRTQAELPECRRSHIEVAGCDRGEPWCIGQIVTLQA